MNTWRRVSHDIDEQAALLPGWPQECLQLEGGRLTCTVEGLATGGAAGLFRQCTDRRLLKSFGTPRDVMAVAVLAQGSDPVHFQGLPAQAGDALLLPAGGSFDIVCHGRFDALVATLDVARLLAWGRATAGFAARVLPGADSLAHRLEALLREPPADAAWQLEDTLLALLLPLPGAAPEADAALLREARRLLQRDPPPPLDEVAARLGVSVRWLHAAFRRRLGLPPARYGQTQRLAWARRELRAAQGRTSVTDVALRYGFAHFGRFAQAYRRQFGELPSQTLRAAA